MNVSNWLSVLACPLCHGALIRRNEFLFCDACAEYYPIRNNIVHLVPASGIERLDAIALQYREMRLVDGWLPMMPDQKRALPNVSPAGYASLYWKVRRQSFAVLKRYLSPSGGARRVGIAADIGAGTGWLSARLTEAGYRAVALDASIDEDFGLGGCEAYSAQCNNRLIAVRGDLEYLPFQKNSLHLAIFNASLHYAAHLPSTLARARDALAPNGLLIVMDTPVSRKAKQGKRLGSRHVGERELHDALTSVGFLPRSIPVSRGLSWVLHQARLFVHGKTPFALPLVVAVRS